MPPDPAASPSPLVAGDPSRKAPTLSLVIPTYNEAANVAPMVAAVAAVLGGTRWELIFVDDDSPDGTWAVAGRIAQRDPRVRCIRRVGRRGLSSAVIEGALAASAPSIAVMDADFQHDEAILPEMLRVLDAEGADLVVGTRYATGGGLSDWARSRRQMSDVATRASRLLVGDQTSDPMSGFFLVRQAVFFDLVYDLSQQGYKILLDLIASAPRPLRIAEVPYVFRSRREGESKISLMVLAEFAFLLVDKVTRGLVPPRLVLFAVVGGLGVGVHLAVLALADRAGFGFFQGQALATLGAMVFNFLVNNRFTYGDRRLTDVHALWGLAVFILVCSVGGLANVGVANLAIERTNNWTLSGIAGAVMGALFNFGVSNRLVWGVAGERRRRRRRMRAVAAAAREAGAR